MITIFNTLSGKKERLMVPRNGLKMFVCGPTVYDYAHIGHARTYIFFDTVARYLRRRGIKLFYLQNITDIDDKILKKAGELKEKPAELAMRMEKEYLKDMKTLGVVNVDKYARASAHMSEIKKQIKTLFKKGFAYQTDSGVYFEVKKFPRFGQLAKQNLEELRPGWRVELDPQKKDPLDFALWKRDQGEFTSPWGKGRPGWHIEDTAISEKYFGPQYDLHGAAVDLKFPHHEAEIAQQEAASGKKPFVKIWLHTGFLLINSEKMSKSMGNFVTIREFIKKYPPAVLRMLVLSHHYRSPINYNDELANQVKSAINTVTSFLIKLAMVRKKTGKRPTVVSRAIGKSEQRFEKAMADDFNTQKAMAIIFEIISRYQKELTNLNKQEANLLKNFVSGQFDLLGIELTMPKISAMIRQLVKEREKMRKKKDFTRADAFRKRIEQLGYNVEDTPLGPVVLKS